MGTEFAAVFTAVQTLFDYTEQHFAFEENLLCQCNYPDLEGRIVEHAQLIADVRRQWSRIEQGSADLACEVITTIERWSVEHINGEDLEYAKFVQADVVNCNRFLEYGS